MKIRLYAVLALVGCGLLWGPSVSGQKIQFRATTIASDITAPPDEPLIAFGTNVFYAYKKLDNGEGTCTNVLGLASLAGINPANLTFSNGDLELLDNTLIRDPGQVTERYGEMDGSPRYFRLYLNGTLVAAGGDLSINVITVSDPNSALFGRAVGNGQVTLQPVGQSALMDEIAALTGGSGLASLNISTFYSLDTNYYTVRSANVTSGFNANGEISFTPVLPVISQQPASQTVNSGATVTFTVVAPGKAPYLTYQWKFNNSDIAGATAASLTLNNVSQNQAGSYAVSVGNVAGRVASQAAILTVNPSVEPPRITLQPHSVTTTNGGTASFSVAATGSPPLLYQWQFNGASLAGSIGSILTLTEVTPAQAGNYSVVVSNAAGFVASTAASLIIITNTPAENSVDATFQTGIGFDSTVFAMAPAGDGKIMVSGNFHYYDNGTAWRIARLNPDGRLDGSFSATLDDAAFQLAVQNDGKVLICGGFSLVNSVNRKGLARLNTNGILDTNFLAMVDNGVYSMALQSDGIILIGGMFANVNGTARSLLARLNPDGRLDATFAPVLNGNVTEIVVLPDGKYLIGGAFSTVNGASRRYLARLNNNGTLDASFDAGSDAQPAESLLVQADGKIVLGGYFFSMAGLPRNGIARLLPNGAIDTGFDPGTGIAGASQPGILALAALPDQRILAAGNFAAFNGISRVSLALLYPDGSLDTHPCPAVWNLVGQTPYPGTINAMLRQPDGQIVIGGEFGAIDNIPARNIARLVAPAASPVAPVITLNPASQTVTNGAPVSFNVQAIGMQPLSYQWKFANLVLANATNATLDLVNVTTAQGGDYLVIVSNAAGSVTSRVATLTVQILVAPQITVQPRSVTTTNGGTASFSVAATGSSPLLYQWQFNGANLAGSIGSILTLTGVAPAQAGNYSVVVSNAAGFVASAAAALIINTNTPADSAVDATFQTGVGFDQTVMAMAPAGDGKIMVSGNFHYYDNGTAWRIARLNPDGRLDGSFSATLNEAAFQLAVQNDGKVLIGGGFSLVNSVNRMSLARLNTNGILDTNFLAVVDNGVYSLALQSDGLILIGGMFTKVNGTARSLLARLNPDGRLDATFAPVLNGNVTEIVVLPDGKYLIGGAFSTVNGASRRYLARLNNNGTLDASFDAGSDAQPAESLLVQADGKIVLGGYFFSMAGLPRNGIARLLPNGAIDTGFDPGTGIAGASQPGILALAALPDQRILAAGNFATFNGVSRVSLALLYPDGSLDTHPCPAVWNLVGQTPYPGTINAMLRQPDGQIVIGGEFGAIDNIPARNIARLVAPAASPAPVITLNPASQTVVEGAEVNFTVIATSQQPMTYQWKFNGFEIAGATNSTLTLAHVAPMQAGNYSVLVSNADGSTLSSLAVLVINGAAQPPVIATQPASLTVTNGATVSFSVSATGTEPLRYQWKFNGQTFPGGTNATLTLTNVSVTQAGFYMVVVSNPGGQVSSQMANLVVVNPPAYNIRFASTMVASDSSSPPEEPLIVIQGVPFYAFKSLDNGQGTNLSINGLASLTGLNAGDITFTMGDLELLNSALIHDATTVTERYANMDATPALFKLYRRGALIASSTNPVLNAVTTTDAASPQFGKAIGYGQATMQAENNDPLVGEILSLTGSSILQFKLNSFSPLSFTPGPRGGNASALFAADGEFFITPVSPVITQQPSSRAAATNTEVVLQVVAAGQAPFLTYQWRFNDLKLDGETNTVLRISNFTTNRAGAYSAVISNAVGAVTSQVAQVTVATPAPLIIQQPKGQTIVPGGKATLSVGVTGTGMVQYQWQFNGVSIPGATGPTLELDKVTLANAGKYSVVITDVFGTAKSDEVVLNVQELQIAPTITVQPHSVTVTNGGQVMLNIQAAGSGVLVYQWKYNGAAITGATNATLVISNAAPGASGAYTVEVSNNAGFIASQPVMVTVGLEPALGLNMYAGITVAGSVGSRYQIERQFSLGSNTNWSPIAILTLTNATQVYIDYESPRNPKSFYRANLVP